MKNKTIIILAVIFLGLLAAYYLMENPSTDIYDMSEARVEPLFGGLSTDNIAKIKITTKNAETNLARTDTGWVVVEEDNFPANEDLINQILESLPEMTTEEIASNNPENAEFYKVDPENGVRVRMMNKNDKVLADYYVGKNGPGRNSYVRVEGDDLVTIQENVFKYQYDKSTKAWRNRSIVKFDAEKVKRLEITRPGAPKDTPLEEAAGGATETVALVKNAAGEWEMMQPEFRNGNKSNIQNVVRTFSNLTASDIPPQDAENTGLDEPYITARVVMEDGLEHTAVIGAKREKANNYFAKNVDSDLIFAVAKYQVDTFRKSLDELGTVPAEEPAATEMEGGEAPGGMPASDGAPVIPQSGIEPPPPPGE